MVVIEMDINKSYALWKEALEGTEEYKELVQLETNKEELSDSFYKEMEFGTAGMRGIIGMGTNRMNIYTVRRATQALANHINKIGQAERGVAIAYDTRKNSELFARETAGILLKNGIKVYLYSTPHSVPQLSFTILHLHCVAGVVITASHNPPAYNGYKVYGEDGGQLPVADSDKITQYIAQIDNMFELQGLSLDSHNPLLQMIGEELDEIYYKKVEDLCIHPDIVREQANSLNIVYTPLHGTGLVPIRRVLTDLGIQKLHIVEQQKDPDPTFKTVKAPNPEERDSFNLAIALANEKDANLILATDPDSDRLGVAVRNPQNEFVILTGNEIGCLLMDYVLSQKKDTFSGDEFVVKSIVTTDMVDRIAAHYHVELRSVFTGFKFIAEQIKISEQTKQGKFIFGFEESYGYLQGSFVRDKDAIQGAMMIAEAACYYASKGISLYEAVQKLYQHYGWFSELVISKTLYGQEGIAKITNAVESLRKEMPCKIGNFTVKAIRDYKLQQRTDLVTEKTTPIKMEPSNVLYFELEDARFIIRPSGTEPKLKSYLSAISSSKASSQMRMEQLIQACNTLLDTLLK